MERVLRAHPGVDAAAVDARPAGDGGTRLVAWLAPEVPDDARTWLAKYLPPHLIPAAFVGLARLPLTSAGKLDRRALPDPDRTPVGACAVEPPETATERLLAELWRELLHVEAVNALDNFFDLGGHSLLATQLLARLPVELPLTVLFDQPTLRDLAAHIDALDRTAAPAEEVVVVVT